MLGQRLQLGLFGGERLGDDALGGTVHAGVGDRVEPVDQLGTEVVEIAEAGPRKKSWFAEMPQGFRSLQSQQSRARPPIVHEARRR